MTWSSGRDQESDHQPQPHWGVSTSHRVIGWSTTSSTGVIDRSGSPSVHEVDPAGVDAEVRDVDREAAERCTASSSESGAPTSSSELDDHAMWRATSSGDPEAATIFACAARRRRIGRVDACAETRPEADRGGDGGEDPDGNGLTVVAIVMRACPRKRRAKRDPVRDHESAVVRVRPAHLDDAHGHRTAAELRAIRDFSLSLCSPRARVRRLRP